MDCLDGANGFLFIYPISDGEGRALRPMNAVRVNKLPYNDDISFVVGVSLSNEVFEKFHSMSKLIHVETNEEMDLFEEEIEINEDNSFGMEVGKSAFSFMYKEKLKGLSLQNEGLYRIEIYLRRGYFGEEDNPECMAKAVAHFHLIKDDGEDE